MTWQEELNSKRLAEGGWYGCIVDDGWKNIVLATDKQLAYIDPNYKINQIKEKFGTLRYYFETDKVGIELDIMYAIASYGERLSASTCERCGKYGKLREDRSWVLTLCDICNAERNAEFEKGRASE